jgi:hypothetical protein
MMLPGHSHKGVVASLHICRCELVALPNRAESAKVTTQGIAEHVVIIPTLVGQGGSILDTVVAFLEILLCKNWFSLYIMHALLPLRTGSSVRSRRLPLISTSIVQVMVSSYSYNQYQSMSETQRQKINIR